MNGSGNGVIAGVYMAAPPATATATAESNNFWWHLRLAGFVAGATSGQAAWSQPVNSVGGLVGVQSTAPGTSATAPGLSGLVLCSANVPDKIASAVDTQVDDQRSSTGQMFGYQQGTTPNPDISGPSTPRRTTSSRAATSTWSARRSERPAPRDSGARGNLMDQAMLAKMVRAGKITPEEVLAHTPLDRLDDTLTLLKRHEFGEFKDIYFKHCGSVDA